MKCVKPIRVRGNVVACSKCVPCRFANRRVIKTRIMLEAMQWEENAFVTLTYNDQNLPWTTSDGFGVPTLVPRDLQLFTKRLRKAWKNPFRIFAVGEYGDGTRRPHYHLGGFNFPNCFRGETRKTLVSQRCIWRECCDVCRMVGEAWSVDGEQFGDIEVRSLDAAKCEYLAGYTLKKMTTMGDVRLDGAHPEFPRYPRGGRKRGAGGLGSAGVAELARVIRRYVDPDELFDVPMVVNHQRHALPLGRYMREKLRLELGLFEEVWKPGKGRVKKAGAPRDAQMAGWLEHMLPMHEIAKANKISVEEVFAIVNAGYEAKLKAQMELRKGKL